MRRGTPNGPLSEGEIVFRAVKFVLEAHVKINALPVEDFDPTFVDELRHRLGALAALAQDKADALLDLQRR